MKFIKFIAYLFYDYYSTGPREHIKYTATLGVMTLLFFLNLVTFFAFFNLGWLLPKVTGIRIYDYFKTFLFLLPIWLTFRLLIKEKDLESADYDTDKIITGKFWLLCYFILSLIMFVLSILWKEGKI